MEKQKVLHETDYFKTTAELKQSEYVLGLMQKLSRDIEEHETARAKSQWKYHTAANSRIKKQHIKSDIVKIRRELQQLSRLFDE